MRISPRRVTIFGLCGSSDPGPRKARRSVFIKGKDNDSGETYRREEGMYEAVIPHDNSTLLFDSTKHDFYFYVALMQFFVVRNLPLPAPPARNTG